MTRRPKAHRVSRHNKVLFVLAAIYRSLHVQVTVEVRGLYTQLTSYGEHKPADMLVPASTTGSDKAKALDITITDLTNKTALDRESHAYIVDRGSHACIVDRGSHSYIVDRGSHACIVDGGSHS